MLPLSLALCCDPLTGSTHGDLTRMTSRQGQLSLAFLNCMDLGLMLSALVASIVILYSPDAHMSVTEYSEDFLVTRIKLSNAILGAILLIVWHFCFKAYGLYQSYRLRTTTDAV